MDLVIDTCVIITIDDHLHISNFFAQYSKALNVKFERLEEAEKEYELRRQYIIDGLNYVSTKCVDIRAFNKILALLNEYNYKIGKPLSNIDLLQMAYALYKLKTQKQPCKFLTEENVMRKFIKNHEKLNPLYNAFFCSTKDILKCYCDYIKQDDAYYEKYLSQLSQKRRSLNHLPDPKGCFCKESVKK